MAKQCSSCVFTRTPDGRDWVYPQLAHTVENRMMSYSQICHAPALKGKKQDRLCRGTRDRQIDIMYKMGVIAAPTDAAWEAKRKELGI
jgi:hypothetical protein